MNSVLRFNTRFGTLPFIGFALLIIMGIELVPGRMDILFLSYSALVLSFIGGINWGVLLSHNEEISEQAKPLAIVSVFMMLLPWAVLFIHKMPIAYFLMGLLYLVERVVEAKYRSVYKEWFFKMRGLPMLVSILTLWAVYAFKLLS